MSERATTVGELNRPSAPKLTLADYATIAGFVVAFVTVSGHLAVRLQLESAQVGFPDVPREMVLCYGGVTFILNLPILLFAALAAHLTTSGGSRSLWGIVESAMLYAASCTIAQIILQQLIIPTLCRPGKEVSLWPLSLPISGVGLAFLIGLLLGTFVVAKTILIKAAALAGAALIFLFLIISSTQASRDTIADLKPEFFGPTDIRASLLDTRTGKEIPVQLIHELPNDIIFRESPHSGASGGAPAIRRVSKASFELSVITYANVTYD